MRLYIFTNEFQCTHDHILIYNLFINVHLKDLNSISYYHKWIWAYTLTASDNIVALLKKGDQTLLNRVIITINIMEWFTVIFLDVGDLLAP